MNEKPAVLIVEDNSTLQSEMRDILGDEFRLTMVASGGEAFASLASMEPDLILSDVAGPVELLRHVKGHERWKFIPFIVLSARVTRGEKIACLGEGADDYLEKPVDAGELKMRLKVALRTRALYRELEQRNCELEDARGGLQRKVEERTYELSLQSQKAMAANKAKDQFLANMSHEMRTPLTAIIGFTDLIGSGVTPSDSEEFHAIIRRNANHLLSLIDEILDFSKIESGHVSIERSEIDIRELFESMQATFKPIIDRKGLRLSIKIDAGVPAVITSDPKRLRQMVTNLLGNAVKFTEEGSVRVEVHVIDDRGAPQLRVRVVDTGIGICAEAHARLFAPFSQADMSLSRKFGGTGLGLALSRKIARSLGGEMMIEASEPGVGSAFVLWVPIEIPVQPALGSLRARVAQAPIGTLGGLKILLAEDSEDNRCLMKRLLEKAGASLETAADGDEAVKLARTSDFDVVLMDIQMPLKDGYAATRELRSQGFKRPILALTAHASAQDLERVLEAGCNDRLVKPVAIEQMISSILASTSITKT